MCIRRGRSVNLSCAAHGEALMPLMPLMPGVRQLLRVETGACRQVVPGDGGAEHGAVALA